MTDGNAREFRYTALRLEQQPGAPSMYLLGVDAETLLQWADVPNAKADYMAGYQRVYSADRAKDIQEFLAADPNNIIPGSVIVTVDGSAVTVDPAADGEVVSVTIHVTDRSFEEHLKDLHERFSGRLSDDERESIAEGEVDAEAEVDSVEDTEEEVGIPESYIATLTAELRAALDDFDGLPAARQEAIRNYITSVSKPGLIIDGQHRVFGAKDVSQHSVRLPVVLMPGLSTAEQVFHFYVLNNKAKPLSPMELRRTISTSLSNAEIDALWKRFEDAGVNPQAVRWTHKLDTDPRSPFRGLIDFGLGGTGFIKENVAYQVVSKFVGMPRKYRVLYKDVPAFVQKTDDRLDYFFAFWSAIKERYQEAWDAGVAANGNPLHQLFYKAAMLVLQEYLLDQLVQVMNFLTARGEPSPFTDVDELKENVKALLTNVPQAFFTTEWQEKQLDTTERRAFLRSQIEEVVAAQGKNIGNRRLFKKQA